jgi:hypothetical protein
MFLGNDRDQLGGGRSRIEIASSGMLRVVLLFGSVAVALALILAPVLDNSINGFLARNDDMQGVDMMRTGTIGTRSTTYTIRRSVLQSGPNSVCIMRSNGTSSGDC